MGIGVVEQCSPMRFEEIQNYHDRGQVPGSFSLPSGEARRRLMQSSVMQPNHSPTPNLLNILLPPPTGGGVVLENSYKEQKRSQELT